MIQLPARRGRPPQLSAAAKVQAQDELLDMVAEGMTTTAAATVLGISTIIVDTWLESDKEFRERYKRARIAQAHALADHAIAVSQRPATTMVEVKRNDLEIETIKWFVSKSAPRQYGDKVQHDHTLLQGVVILPPLDYGQKPVPALRPEDQIKSLPPGES